MTLQQRLLTGVLGVAVGVALACPAPALVWVVSNTNDSGSGSLRAAITSANGSSATPHTIQFSIPGSGPFVIGVTSGPLPTLTRPTAIQGIAAPGSSTPGIVLDGSALASGDGITFGTGSGGSSVSLLAITGFPGFGITIASGSAGDQVSRCFVGVAADGHTAAGNDGGGISVGGANATIGTSSLDGNLIAGNGGPGIQLLAGGAGAAIRGNSIGTDITGTVALPNTFGIAGTAESVTVGGPPVGLFSAGNLISGNSLDGVAASAGANFWVIAGNRIGTDAAAVAPLGNGGAGISVGASALTIGGTTTHNVISGNAGGGVVILGGTSFNNVFGNFIGTNGTGSAALGQQEIGVRILGGTCTIGGSDTAHRNVISGNGNVGLTLDGSSTGCVITGNFLGVDATAAFAIPNGGGVVLAGSNHRLGGSTAGERNVISGNASDGVGLYGTGSVVEGNYIGTDGTGLHAIANGGNGLRAIGVLAATIGGSAAGQGNLVAGNAGSGITFDPDTSGITVQGNLIGLDASGAKSLPNGGGVSLDGTGHLLGGSTAGARNVISGNSSEGVAIGGASHVVSGNYIGTDASGTAAIANGRGIRVLAGGSSITIGGTGSHEGNVISGNASDGVDMDGGTTGCTLLGNRIGTDASGEAALPNAGFGIAAGGSNHTIGGSASGARNVISANAGGGVYLFGSGPVVAGNFIGVDAAGAQGLGNGGYGIRCDGVSGAVLGGAAAGAGNIISGNQSGVDLAYGSHDNSVLRNVIGLDANGTVNLADRGSGVEIGDSHDNQIGLPGAGNVIGGATYDGVIVSGAGSTGNRIQGNWIGTNPALASGLGNGLFGVEIDNAYGNVVGGSAAGEGNVIADNGWIGVGIDRGEGNAILGNSMFGNAYLGIDVGAPGLEANDVGDHDDGANRGQNYPLLASVVTSGGSTQVDGMLQNEPSTQYRVELFSSPVCGATGFGEGKTFLGSTQVTTDASGNGTLSVALPLVAAEPFVAATVTDPASNTSEFSPCAKVGGANPGKIELARNVTLAYEGNLPTGDVVVTRSEGISGTVAASFTTSDDTAHAGEDYVDSDRVVTFAPGEVVKVVKVPILLDPAPEPTETAKLALAGATGGATLGLAAGDLLIFDYDPAQPGASIDDVTAVEGDGGQKTAKVTVHLTPADHDVTIAFLTEDGTAVAGEDYEETHGTVFFPAGSTAQTISIPIEGDLATEGDETFYVRLTLAPAGGTWVAFDALATVTIVDDDDAAIGKLFRDDFETGDTGAWTHTSP